ncbi:MAG TPA: hypothetical protein VFB37_01880, partial [Steroidobacteraceae bacterium]|nr:hypothetical protein [Steroidobacteraceae bacterium]
RTGAEIRVLKHALLVNSAVFSPDGARIATASDDQTARIWDARTGAQLLVLAGHRDGVTAVTFSSDGAYLLTGSMDRTTRLWDATTGTLIAVYVQPGIVSDVAFSPAGHHVLTVSEDGSVRTWSIEDVSALRLQVSWYRAAEFDPLSAIEKAQLGLAENASAGIHLFHRDDGKDAAALARLAQGEERAATLDLSSRERNAHLLHAFTLYAAAARRSTADGRPEELSKAWRYRRATLAHVLARQGMMRQAAETYRALVSGTGVSYASR